MESTLVITTVPGLVFSTTYEDAAGVLEALADLARKVAADNGFDFVKAECFYNDNRQWSLTVD